MGVGDVLDHAMSWFTAGAGAHGRRTFRNRRRAVERDPEELARAEAQWQHFARTMLKTLTEPGRTVPANAFGWVACATHPNASARPQDFVRTADGCRGSRRSCGGPSSCDVASRTSNLLFLASWSLSTGLSHPVITERLSSHDYGKHTRCACTWVAYVTVARGRCPVSPPALDA
ncbi:hypothetical protein GCM10010303_14200 [Streptomyces purpurascens]|nr:hypothetical protein GCM10010303_14200 [Streptomyces purpurascens]